LEKYTLLFDSPHLLYLTILPGLIRFIPKSSPTSNSKFLIGEPIDQNIDVGLALYQGKSVKANVFSGSSVLDAGSPTGESVEVERVLSPVTQRECGTIRCIGLNVSLFPS
jgi:hypothetical protein